MQFDFSSPDKVALMIIEQEGWTLDELTDFLKAYRQKAFLEDSRWFIKFNHKLWKRRKTLENRHTWKEFCFHLDNFTDQISTLKLQSPHA